MIKSYLAEQFVKSDEVETTKTEINEFGPEAKMKFLSLASKTIFNWRSSKREEKSFQVTTRYGQVAYTSEASTKIPDKLEEHSTFLIHPPTDSSVTDVREKFMLSVVVVIPFRMPAENPISIVPKPCERRFKLCRVIKPPGNWGCERAALCERELGT